MNKHKFNIFPEAKKEDFERLKADIHANGFDKSQPITTYEGEILDGWNRLKACQELTIAPVFTKFTGSASDAIAFVMRTNKRRNLNSGQWATIAAEAEELIAAIAEEASKKKGGRPKKDENWPCHHCGGSHPIGDNPCHKTDEKQEEKPSQKIDAVSPNNRRTESKAAELFNTNRTYVNNAVKMKEAAPEVFEKVKAGTMTMQDGMKAVRAIPIDPWSESERKRQSQVQKGLAVVANAAADKNLIAWAESNNKAMRVDRGTKFGNPFVLDDDGTRNHVCDCYEHNYLPNKPSILNATDVLKGKVLICHCYPLRCHGDALAALANGVKHTNKPSVDLDAKSAKAEAKRLRKAADELDPPTKFRSPDLEEVTAYFAELKAADPDSFFDFYESKGWLVGKVSMKDWKASARKWVRENQTNGKVNGNGHTHRGTGKRGLTAEDVFSPESLGRGR